MNAAHVLRRTLSEDKDLLPADLHPVIKRAYLARGITTADELDYSLDRLIHPNLLKGMPQAVALLADAIFQDKRILIVADFDTDGASSAALAIRALIDMGANNVLYLVPDRFRLGYGLTPAIVDIAVQHNPDLIVTVDNGISSIDGVAAAQSKGIKVCVTDHHLPGTCVPAADALVNPNQSGDKFPSKHLAGVGVVFYVMLALRAHLREQDWFKTREIAEPKLADRLDLVALGTVADLVKLDNNNRLMISQGVSRIRRSQCIAGIRALYEVGNRNLKSAHSRDLGFNIAPRLNAAGRLENMSLGIDCLLTDDLEEARTMAGELDRLNKARREIQVEMQAQATEAVKSLRLNGDDLPWGLCLYDERWHEGVVGLVASKVKEKYHRPVVAMTLADNGDIKGSARSISGLHIRDTLDSLAAKHPGILEKFGGHAMAAGLTIGKKHLERFCQAFEEEVRCRLSRESLEQTIYIDGELTGEDLDLGLACKIHDAGPWGQGFPEPLFEGRFILLRWKLVGTGHIKMELKHPKGKRIHAIAFNQLPDPELCEGSMVEIIYRLSINEFRGDRTLQLVVERINLIKEESVNE